MFEPRAWCCGRGKLWGQWRGLGASKFQALTLTMDSRGSEHVMAEVESQVDVQIHLAVEKIGGRSGVCLQENLPKFPPTCGG
jgi:hypothetical protein